MYPQTYSVDELSARCGLASYILRYWQIQFPQLRESDGSPKTRFTVNDEALVMRIKKFLYVDHLSIEETKARIAEEIKFPIVAPHVGVKTQTEQAAKAEASAPQAPAEPETVPQAAEPEVPVQAPVQPEPAPAAVAPQAPVYEPSAVQPDVSVLVAQASRKAVNEALAQAKKVSDGEIARVRAQADAVSGQFASLKEQLAARDAELSELRLNRTAMTEELRRVKAVLNEKEVALASVEERLAAAEERVASMRTELTAGARTSCRLSRSCSKKRRRLRFPRAAPQPLRLTSSRFVRALKHRLLKSAREPVK